jgi:hypothetical protein
MMKVMMMMMMMVKMMIMVVMMIKLALPISSFVELIWYFSMSLLSVIMIHFLGKIIVSV